LGKDTGTHVWIEKGKVSNLLAEEKSGYWARVGKKGEL